MDESSPRYGLAPHAFVCRVREAVVLLDLTNDRYLTVHGEQMRALGAAVHGWPAQAEPGSHARGAHLAEQLRQKGLLTLDAAAGKRAEPIDLSVDEVPIAVGIDRIRVRRIRFLDVVNFLFAWARMSWSLRWRGLYATVSTVQRRNSWRADEPFDENAAVELVCVFRRLRCYTFVAHEKCLLHALVLTDFLARHGVYPTFVMGVRLGPWAAHSWVQEGRLVLDATPASIRDFTPILAA
jgi:hypothetical protein